MGGFPRRDGRGQRRGGMSTPIDANQPLGCSASKDGRRPAFAVRDQRSVVADLTSCRLAASGMVGLAASGIIVESLHYRLELTRDCVGA
jgi:hypothetical protein